MFMVGLPKRKETETNVEVMLLLKAVKCDGGRVYRMTVYSVFGVSRSNDDTDIVSLLLIRRVLVQLETW